MAKIRIMHIAECAGGVDRYLGMLFPLLEEEFEQTFVCSLNYDQAKYISVVDRVVQVEIKQTFSPLAIIRQVKQLRGKIKEIKPEIVYCHSSFAGGLGRLACIRTSCKVVYNPHGWAFNIH